ncbi:MAG: L-aspartate oxidase [Vallitaleaceae bacterium]|jgi:L-aspartate oxidase|nr:L-aspartate oxidase [Vallitaleaceae bacterium]
MERFLVSFDTTKLEKTCYDVIIIGAGIGGLYTALTLPDYLSVLIVSKEPFDHTNSYKAQGGIACVMDDMIDHVDKHIVDTMKCGHYTNNVEAVNILITEARKNINQLIDFGVNFDKDNSGKYRLGMEGAHSQKRILHRGDTTGAHIMDVLSSRIRERDNITWTDDGYVLDILSQDNQCFGILMKRNNILQVAYSNHTILATGGIGRALNFTTNDPVSTGDGIGMALRASVQLGDMNYLQYHPTVFADPLKTRDNFLISEAVRGEGATILDENHVSIMADLHPQKDLAPRDIVAKAIFDRLKTQEHEYVYLDMTHFTNTYIETRFPYIYEKCMKHGLNPNEDLIPIMPMMHYHMGGVSVDLNGQTSMNHLYAVGECANTGVHGKNRLASNSLLEAIVFGNRIAKHIDANKGLEICEKDICYTVNKPFKTEMDTIYQISHMLNQYFVTKRRTIFKRLKKYLKDHEQFINVPSKKRANLENYNMYCTIKAIYEFEANAIKEELEGEKNYVIKAAN